RSSLFPYTPLFRSWAIWHERWARELGVGSVVASVAAGPGGLARPRPYHFTVEGMRSYLTSLPSSAGGVLWPGGSVPQYVSDAVSSWEPGGSALGTLAYTIRDALVRPGAAAILAIVALLSILFSLVIL